MTLENLRNYLETAKEKYPISTEFTKNYQQSPANKNGYVYYAWEHGLSICKKTADPSQKWHFLEAYTGLLLADPSNNITQSTDARIIYNRIRCPELLLWLAEAAGIKPEKVQKCAAAAKEIINASAGSRSRNTAGNKIREMIPWEDIEAAINLSF